MRVGIGYDVHQLKEGLPLVLGGVRIPHAFGLLGHSDADCLVHAVIDALLGAACMGDIGTHFPPGDEKYKGISSIVLLKETKRIIEGEGFRVNNVDATVVAQRPRLMDYIPEMRENLSSALGIDQSRISIKATTTEHLGFEGREEGISAFAVCTIYNLEN